MDPKKEREVTPKSERSDDGHSITYKVVVRRLRVLQSWAFKKTYKTECDFFPTLWDLRLEFVEVRADATASLSVALERSDSENDINLEASIWVQIYDFHDSLVFPKQVFERENMRPGDALRETVEISSFPDRREAINGRIVVRISIVIRFCHTDTESFPSESASSHSNSPETSYEDAASSSNKSSGMSLGD